MSTIYNYDVLDIKGNIVKMKTFKGYVVLIVNTASQCGFTKQYSQLEALYQKFKHRNFKVLGFPCNQFGGQEPDSEEEILNFCTTRFQVSFPLFSKINVNGQDAHPLFKFLKSSLKGILGSEMIKWNFTKFLVDRTGKPIERFAPKDNPENLIPIIEEELNKEVEYDFT